jgi:hypothetical protein
MPDAFIFTCVYLLTTLWQKTQKFCSEKRRQIPRLLQLFIKKHRGNYAMAAVESITLFSFKIKKRHCCKSSAGCGKLIYNLIQKNWYNTESGNEYHY